MYWIHIGVSSAQVGGDPAFDCTETWTFSAWNLSGGMFCVEKCVLMWFSYNLAFLSLTSGLKTLIHSIDLCDRNATKDNSSECLAPLEGWVSDESQRTSVPSWPKDSRSSWHFAARHRVVFYPFAFWKRYGSFQILTGSQETTSKLGILGGVRWGKIYAPVDPPFVHGSQLVQNHFGWRWIFENGEAWDNLCTRRKVQIFGKQIQSFHQSWKLYPIERERFYIYSL